MAIGKKRLALTNWPKKGKLVVVMEGGSPWFGYFWIGNRQYTITQWGNRTPTIKKSGIVKLGSE